MATPRSCLPDLLPGLVPHPYGSHPNCSPTAAQLHCVRAVQSLHSPRTPSSWHPLCQHYFFMYGVYGVMVSSLPSLHYLECLLETQTKRGFSTLLIQPSWEESPRICILPKCPGYPYALKHERFLIRKSKPLQREHFMVESLVIPPPSSSDTSPCGLGSKSNKLRTKISNYFKIFGHSSWATPHCLCTPFSLCLEFPLPLPAKLLFIFHL